MAEGSSSNNALFARTTLIALVLTSLVSFIAWVVLSAYAEDLDPGQDGRPHALSKSSIGYAGIVRLMNAIQPGQAHLSRGQGSEYNRSLNVITLDRWMSFGEDQLDTFSTPILIILPKWNARRKIGRRGWVEQAPDRPLLDKKKWAITTFDGEQSVFVEQSQTPQNLRLEYYHSRDEIDWNDTASTRQRIAKRGLKPSEFATPIKHLQTMRGSNLEPILVDENGHIVLALLGGYSIYVLSEPDLINNAGLSEADRAAFSLSMLKALGTSNRDTIFFDVSMHGFDRTRNMMKLAFEPPFGAATLCTFIAALVLSWRAGTRFGPTKRAERAYALGKRALADNSAALIKLARRDHRYAQGYLDLVRRAAAKLMGAPRNLYGEALDKHLDRYVAARHKDGDAAPTLAELRTEAGATHDRASLIQVARRIFKWKQEFSRERL